MTFQTMTEYARDSLTERLIIMGAVVAVLSGEVDIELCDDCPRTSALIPHLRQHLREALAAGEKPS